MIEKLYRSTTDRMLAGVCGGLGEYLGIDPVFIRIFFVLLLVANGIGLLVYFMFWVIVPNRDQKQDANLADITRANAQEIAGHVQNLKDELVASTRNPHPQAIIYLGVGLILLGTYYLLDNLRLPWLRWLHSDAIWPVLIIFAGVGLLISWRRK
jgi:phage shock protein C